MSQKTLIDLQCDWCGVVETYEEGAYVHSVNGSPFTYPKGEPYAILAYRFDGWDRVSRPTMVRTNCTQPRVEDICVNCRQDLFDLIDGKAGEKGGRA